MKSCMSHIALATYMYRRRVTLPLRVTILSYPILAVGSAIVEHFESRTVITTTTTTTTVDRS